MTWWDRFVIWFERLRHRRKLLAVFACLSLAVSACAPVGGRSAIDADDAESNTDDAIGPGGDSAFPSPNVAARQFIRRFAQGYAENAEQFAQKIEAGQFNSWDDCIDEWSKANAFDRETAWRDLMQRPLFDAMGGASGPMSDGTRSATARAARDAAAGFRAALAIDRPSKKRGR